MNNLLQIIGRSNPLFENAYKLLEKELYEQLCNSRILVVGAAGSIGQAVTKELFKFAPKCLHAIDISENNLVELVRQIRSTSGYTTEDFLTFCIDVGSLEFDVFIQNQKPYDYIFNLSALKHVRSEKDPFTLMRMIKTNVLNSVKLHNINDTMSNSRYFCVSSDKAADPENLMGATKRIMELFAFRDISKNHASMARFANVAFSDGSLLHGFQNRINDKQPITAPSDIMRYFITPKEAAQLCILSAVTANNGEIYFPIAPKELKPIKFSDIAINYLEYRGYEPVLCDDENEARNFFVSHSHQDNKYPCLFFCSDTTGEKSLEQFYTQDEKIITNRMKNIGIVKPDFKIDEKRLAEFVTEINNLRLGNWNKIDLLNAIQKLVPNMKYEDHGKYLDGKM